MPHKKATRHTPTKKRAKKSEEAKLEHRKHSNGVSENSLLGLKARGVDKFERPKTGETTLTSELKDGVLSITFADRVNGNSLSLETVLLLEKIVLSHQSACRALLFKSSYRIFCSGGNLKNYALMKTALEGKRVNREIQRVLNYIYLLKIPTAVVVDGDCWGGGLELLSCFDFVVATPHVFFGLWQRKNGLTTGWGGGRRLQNRISNSIFRKLAISTRQFNAYEAHEMGIVDELAINKSLAEIRAQGWLDAATKGPQRPTASLKKMTGSNETKLFEEHWWSQEHQGILQSRKK